MAIGKGLSDAEFKKKYGITRAQAEAARTRTRQTKGYKKKAAEIKAAKPKKKPTKSVSGGPIPKPSSAAKKAAPKKAAPKKAAPKQRVEKDNPKRPKAPTGTKVSTGTTRSGKPVPKGFKSWKDRVAERSSKSR